MDNKIIDITALGELLIDYTPMGKSPAGMEVFEQNPGGAPANVLACAAKLGNKTAFIGKVGKDMQGQFLINTLKNASIDTSGIITDENFFTTLAFVSLNEKGERSFSFARKPGADTQIKSDEVSLSLINSSKIFHFGSLSLTDEPVREATVFAVNVAKLADCIISYDPNYRPLLWENSQQAAEQMRSVIKYVDCMKISDEETELLSGHKEPAKAAEALVSQGVPLVVVTLGKEGSLFATKDGTTQISGFKADVVDTTGAGDSFWGAFLYMLVNSGKKPQQLSMDEIKQMCLFANAAAAICVGKRGAIPALPELKEIEALLASQ